jgi:hypothetical protein
MSKQFLSISLDHEAIVSRVFPTKCDHPTCNGTELCPGAMICEPQGPQSLRFVVLFSTAIYGIDCFARLCLVPFVPARY